MRCLAIVPAQNRGNCDLYSGRRPDAGCPAPRRGGDLMRILVSLIAGGLFGAGLFVSGMANTDKVQGWLDVFGAWEPTLAFVMGGAIIPMFFFAWRLTQNRQPLTGGAFPTQTRIGPAPDHGVRFCSGWVGGWLVCVQALRLHRSAMVGRAAWFFWSRCLSAWGPRH